MSDLAISENLKSTVAEFIKILSRRSQDIIERRFQLKKGKRETLDAIGQSYGITRERVRQIEEVALRELRKAFNRFPLGPYVQLVSEILHQYGDALREDSLFDNFSHKSEMNPENAALALMMTVSTKFVRQPENDEFFTFWTFNDPICQKRVKEIVARVINYFEKSKNSIEEERLPQIYTTRISREGQRLDEKVLFSYLSLSKKISKNIFAEWGLIKWSHIAPRGIKDKAYLVLRREQEPRHFKEIAKLIDRAGFDTKATNAQTVHNELIKDSRFVLVGRGLYALQEWGYRAGTIKDLIVEYLKSNGPVDRQKILAHVMANRFVKPNTILLALQNPKMFIQRENGEVALRN